MNDEVLAYGHRLTNGRAGGGAPDASAARWQAKAPSRSGGTGTAGALHDARRLPGANPFIRLNPAKSGHRIFKGSAAGLAISVRPPTARAINHGVRAALADTDEHENEKGQWKSDAGRVATFGDKLR